METVPTILKKSPFCQAVDKKFGLAKEMNSIPRTKRHQQIINICCQWSYGLIKGTVEVWIGWNMLGIHERMKSHIE